MDEMKIEKLEKGQAKLALKKLAIYAKPYWGWIILATIVACTSSIIAIIAPNFIGEIIDYISEGLFGEMQTVAIWNIVRMLLILYGMTFVLDFISMFKMTDVSQNIMRLLRRDMNQKIDLVPLAYFDKTSHGDTLSRVTNDVSTLGTTITQSYIALIASFAMLFGSLVMMLRLNVLMAVVALATSIVGFAMMAVIGGASQKHFIAQQEELGTLTGHVEEVFSGHDVVKISGAEGLMKNQMRAINDRLYGSSFKAQFATGVMMPLMMFIGNLSFVTVCVVGAILAFNGDITFGVIAQFMIYIRLFTQPLGEIAQNAMTMQTTVAASHRIFDFLEADEMADESKKLADVSTVKGNVLFDNVQFAYEQDKPIIKGFSASIRAGQKVAIVGPTGAGKTTIVNLLMRFYELNGGAILIDGVNSAKMKREAVYEKFCMVLQDTWLFEASVKENIVYNKENVSDDDIKRVCKAVGLHHYIKSLPQGYHTVLTDKVNLSVGQRQLMTIARAMIADAPLLILDEATSSVDTRTEVLIQKAMDELMVGRTSFVIAHRLSTIKNADLILVMKDGDIIESGTHDELLAADGFYAGLYNSQFEFGVDTE